MNKVCTKCGENKPLNDYAKSERGKHGRRSDCNDCKKAYDKWYKENNKEQYKATWKKSNIKRKDKNKEYRLKNKESRNAYLRSWAKANPEKARGQKLRNRYGIDLDDFNKILESQDNKCAICKSDNPGRGENFHVDHCHESDKVRGLLCDNCNKGLGHFKDEVDFLEQAIKYLKEQKDVL